MDPMQFVDADWINSALLLRKHPIDDLLILVRNFPGKMPIAGHHAQLVELITIAKWVLGVSNCILVSLADPFVTALMSI